MGDWEIHFGAENWKPALCIIQLGGGVEVVGVRGYCNLVGVRLTSCTVTRYTESLTRLLKIGCALICFIRNDDLIALGFMDDHYPVRSAFYLLNQVLDEYQKNFGDSWKTVNAYIVQEWTYPQFLTTSSAQERLSLLHSVSHHVSAFSQFPPDKMELCNFLLKCCSEARIYIQQY